MKHLASAFLVIALLPILVMVAGGGHDTPRALAAGAPRDAGSGEVRALIMLTRFYGGNTNLIRDAMEFYGWNFTYTGLDSVVENCFYGEPKAVDVLIGDITDLSGYDVLAIMPGNSGAPGGSHGQLLASPEAVSLVSQAAQEGLLVMAFCGGVRVLAAADVINGIHVTGKAAYLQEYLDAGAIWAGEPSPPIRDGNILTSVRNQLHSTRVIEISRTAVDSLRAARAAK
ncbi:MAG: DJ-1/PfpI family protein [bacterium]|jgi:putative intracellular protease/amidase